MVYKNFLLVMILVCLLPLYNGEISSLDKTTVDPCGYNANISKIPAYILCAIEKKIWYVSAELKLLTCKDCLIGSDRCAKILAIPNKDMLPTSKAPPLSKNKQYQLLATTAEKLVPQNYWRDGFDSDLLLLSHNDSDLPDKLASVTTWNRRLKNLYQCSTRQLFIRRSFASNITIGAIDSESEPINILINKKCSLKDSLLTGNFWRLWNTAYSTNGENFDISSASKVWIHRTKENNKLRDAATELIQQLLDDFGGIWTGCFKIIRAPNCRFSLAAAAYVLSLHMLADISNPSFHPSKEDIIKNPKKYIKSFRNDITIGYILISLGRSLLHGDLTTSGEYELSLWKLKPIDFITIQSAYLQIYLQSFGEIYTEQLNHYIPIAFTPAFPVHSRTEWKKYSQNLEPVYTSLRNWMFTEAKVLIDFGPYLPLVALSTDIRNKISSTRKRRVLIDVGANGFFASPKYLLDSYAPFLPFTHAIMIEPEPHFSATVPEAYLNAYNITFLQIYAEVNTNSDTDIVKMLPTLITPEDFVVLKFDVDPNRYAQGPTMEWGFIFSLMNHPEIASLIDELYIEIHFHFPSLQWYHYHSNWEALDMLRYLRANGMIVHSWP